MSTDFKLKLNSALADKRVQAGTALGVSALAVVAIIGGASAWVMNDRSKAQPEMADRAKLAIQLQQPKPTGAPSGQLAVLDPNQIQPASTTVQPLTPEMQAMVARDRADQARMVAEQRAFDSRVRSEIMASYRAETPLASAAPPTTAAPQRPAVQTIQTAQQPSAPQLRPIQPPILNRARDEEGYRTPEDDSDRYEARRRYAQEERAYPDRRYPGYDRGYYARDPRDRPPPPPPRRSRDDDEEPDL